MRLPIQCKPVARMRSATRIFEPKVLSSALLDQSYQPRCETISAGDIFANTNFYRIRTTWAGDNNWNNCTDLLNSYRNRVSDSTPGENWQCWQSGNLENGSTLWTADISLPKRDVSIESIKSSLREHFVRDDINFSF